MATHAHDLQPVPGSATPFVQQARLLAWSGRWSYLVAGLLGMLMLTGMAEVPPHVPRVFLVSVFGLIAGIFWAIAVWQGETPTRRTYQWSLPVPRPVNDIARIAAGAVLLPAAFAVLALAGTVWAAVDGTLDRVQAIDPVSWANFFLAPLTVYFLTMPLALWSEYRTTRWVLGLLFCTGPILWITQALGFLVLLDAFEALMSGPSYGLATALFGPTIAELTAPESAALSAWWRAAAFWLSVGGALTAFTAVFRPDDLARTVRGARTAGATPAAA